MARLRFAAVMGIAVCFGLALTAAHPAYAAPPADACALVTSAQVSAVLGVKVGPGEHLVPSSPKLCGFGSAGAAKRVMVAIITPVMFANEKHPLQGIKEETLSGVGDDAHYMTTPGFGTGLSVLKSGFAFKIRVYGFPVEQIEAKEKTLAQQALAKR
jgi:hypothetical protein